jgi:hypothetical protein
MSTSLDKVRFVTCYKQQKLEIDDPKYDDGDINEEDNDELFSWFSFVIDGIWFLCLHTTHINTIHKQANIKRNDVIQYILTCVTHTFVTNGLYILIYLTFMTLCFQYSYSVIFTIVEIDVQNGRNI